MEFVTKVKCRDIPSFFRGGDGKGPAPLVCCKIGVPGECHVLITRAAAGSPLPQGTDLNRRPFHYPGHDGPDWQTDFTVHPDFEFRFLYVVQDDDLTDKFVIGQLGRIVAGVVSENGPIPFRQA